MIFSIRVQMYYIRLLGDMTMMGQKIQLFALIQSSPVPVRLLLESMTLMEQYTNKMYIYDMKKLEKCVFYTYK